MLLSVRLFVLMSPFLAAGPGWADEETRAPDPVRGEALMQARCLACHQEKSISFLVEHCTAERGVAYLETFLERHHAPDAEARADIIAYLTCATEVAPTD